MTVALAVIALAVNLWPDIARLVFKWFLLLACALVIFCIVALYALIIHCELLAYPIWGPWVERAFLLPSLPPLALTLMGREQLANRYLKYAAAAWIIELSLVMDFWAWDLTHAALP